MEQEYLNCEHGLTPQCPHNTNPVMTKLLAGPKAGGKFDSFNIADIEAANALCRECGSFIPRNQ